MTIPLQDLEAGARKLARAIDDVLNKNRGPERQKMGFMLMLFDFEEASFSTYISNAEREGMLAAMRELLERLEAGARQPGDVDVNLPGPGMKLSERLARCVCEESYEADRDPGSPRDEDLSDHSFCFDIDSLSSALERAFQKVGVNQDAIIEL